MNGASFCRLRGTPEQGEGRVVVLRWFIFQLDSFSCFEEDGLERTI